MADQKNFSQTLYRYLEQAELILLAIAGASLAARYVQLEVSMVGLRLSLSGLAAVYFLMAYRPPTTSAATPQAEKKEFRELLALTILPKVLWIGCSVGVIGLMFFLLQMQGVRQLLFIHAASAGIGLGLLLAFRQSGTENSLPPVLYRVVPLLLISVYLLTATS